MEHPPHPVSQIRQVTGMQVCFGTLSAVGPQPVSTDLLTQALTVGGIPIYDRPALQIIFTEQ